MSPDDTPAITSGRQALKQLAPTGAAALEVLERTVWQETGALGKGLLMARIAGVAAGETGLSALAVPDGVDVSVWTPEEAAGWRSMDDLSEVDRAVLDFSQQMAFHVGSVDPRQRTAFIVAAGAAAPSLAPAIYVADLLPRARAALDALFGESEWGTPRIAVDDTRTGLLFAAVEGLIRVVPALQALDPVTTELVRLLGARFHACRLCQSLRSRSALVAGADEAVFERVDAWATSDLPQPQKAALAFADAMIVAPVQWMPEVIDDLRRHWPPAACVELVLDVMRNATNKVAVALGADAPHVESGVEIYDVTPDGEIHYGLDAP